VFVIPELVARTLNELGIETRTGVGRTGVVGYLGDGDGPVRGRAAALGRREFPPE
jgi:metal-dependent amidase/aminoacylase/carboxypeptidase family protein